jgi:hypothetical protein
VTLAKMLADYAKHVESHAQQIKAVRDVYREARRQASGQS